MAAFRILPLTMAMATAMLGVKAADIVQGSNQLSSALVSDATAEEKAPPKEEAKKEEAKAEAKPEAEKAEEKKTEGEHGEKKAETPAKPSAVSETAPDTVKLGSQSYTQSEIDMLQNLAKRREELEQWNAQLEMKDNVLTATEQRINQKLSDMQNLQAQLNVLLASYNQQEDTKIKSLVKIYENMKPGDAARIFEETDMPVLLSIIDKMSERKVAPVLAAMNPKKAQAVTAELAAQRKVSVPKNTDAIGSPSTAGKAPAPAKPASGAAPASATAADPAAKPAVSPTAASAPAPASTNPPAAISEKADAKAAAASSPAPASTAPTAAADGGAADPAKTTTKPKD